MSATISLTPEAAERLIAWRQNYAELVEASEALKRARDALKVSTNSLGYHLLPDEAKFNQEYFVVVDSQILKVQKTHNTYGSIFDIEPV